MGASCCWPRSRREYRVATETRSQSRPVGCIFVTAATSVYFKVICARLSIIARCDFPGAPRALGFRERFGYHTCVLTAKRRDCPGWSGRNSLRFAVARGLKKKNKKKQGTKKQFALKTTDRLSFFFLICFLGAPCVGCGPSVDMPPHVGTRSWLWGLPLRALMTPSCGVFAKHLFLRTFFSNGLFVFSEQEIKFVMSTTTAAVQSKSNLHVTVYYQPVEFTSCVFAVLFLRSRRCCLEATIWAHNCPSDLLGGCWRHGGAGTSQVVSK
jgi:hypothetical protein